MTKSRTSSRTDVRSTPAWTTYGCKNPSSPAVVSGAISAGSSPMNAAATLMAFTISPFAYPGCVLKPWNVAVIASAEKLSVSISPRVPPSSV